MRKCALKSLGKASGNIRLPQHMREARWKRQDNHYGTYYGSKRPRTCVAHIFNHEHDMYALADLGRCLQMHRVTRQCGHSMFVLWSGLSCVDIKNTSVVRLILLFN